MKPEQLLGILACPRCGGDLEADAGGASLTCQDCRLRYPVREAVAILRPDAAAAAGGAVPPDRPAGSDHEAPAETAAHLSDQTRRWIAERPWYRFAAELLPQGAAAAGLWVDLGCGKGEFLSFAAERGLAGAGLDYWEENAAVAARAQHPALAADLNLALPFRSASLDGAALIEVIEHTVRAERLLSELARVLRPGGWLVLTTPNVAHLTYRWRALTGHPPKQEGYHYRFFTRRSLAEAVERAGFRITARASFGKQSLLTKLGRLLGRGRKWKYRYRVTPPLESLLAQHFVWRLERVEASADRRRT